MQRLLYILIGGLLLGISSCSTFEGEYDPYEEILIEEGSYTSVSDSYLSFPDTEPNLYLYNDTEYKLYLYVDQKLTKMIPAYTIEFGVRVETNGYATNNLKLFKVIDLEKEDIYNPPAEKIFKQWDAILPVDTFNAIQWTIDNEQESDTIEKSIVHFHYPTKDALGKSNIYSVDIYLNNQNGAKLASLQPGNVVSIALDYGLQTLLFRYWVSDNTDSSGSREIGWVAQKPNGTDYTVIANSNNKEISFEIPVYFSSYTDDATGFLTIANTSSDDLLIKADGKLLEDFIIVEGESTQGMSYISGKESGNNVMTVKLPVGNLLLEAFKPTSGERVASTVVEITEGSSIHWNIQ
ncbi:hypothetical protein [Algivirga pacifica]|uniref:DUF1735 domain-containing protein n=1 Tax=Algivirga pacifica TaxID=1162670 RepID=A0ABP9DCP2_9BACT